MEYSGGEEEQRSHGVPGDPEGLTTCWGAEPVASLGSVFEPAMCTELSVTAMGINGVIPFYPHLFSLAFIWSQQIHKELALGGEPPSPGATTTTAPKRNNQDGEMP